MINFRCMNVECGEVLHADERHRGRLVMCLRCGLPTECPISSDTSSGRPSLPVWFWPLVGLGVVTLCGVGLSLDFFLGQTTRRPQEVAGGQPQTNRTSLIVPPAKLEGTSPPASRADARGLEILRNNAGTVGDPELGREYRTVNERYFAGALPNIPVAWEPALEDVGPLIAEGFTLEGMWGFVGDRRFILLNPALSADRRRFERTLCHEMVHEYLFTVGDTASGHGPAFQQQLRRLSEEGAFEGIPASDAERASLRDWLGAESARLDSVGAELEETRGDLDRDSETLRRELDDLNARTASANGRGSGWPSDDEIKSFKSRQDLLRQRVADFNFAVERRNADRVHFNLEANRFNLMMSYPDGLDEESVVRPKSAAGGRVRQ